jgi:hypothetical protein
MINAEICYHGQVYLPTVSPPTLVPVTMSPTGEIFSNHSTWSIQVSRQVCDIFVIISGQRLGERGGKGRREKVS